MLGIITLGINNDIPGHGFADLPLLLRFSQILYIYDSQNVLIFSCHQLAVHFLNIIVHKRKLFSIISVLSHGPKIISY